MALVYNHLQLTVLYTLYITYLEGQKEIEIGLTWDFESDAENVIARAGETNQCKTQTRKENGLLDTNIEL